MTIKTDLKQTCSTGLVWLGRLGDAAVDLLFPPRCVICQQMATWLCAGCRAGIETIHPPVCSRCGLPLDLSGSHRGCRAPAHLDGLLASAFHAGALRQAIHDFKYRDLQALAAPLGQLMSQGWAELAPTDRLPDVIVPVPLHPSRQRQRGYNQSALLARELGAQLRRPVVEDTLLRVKATIPQVGLDPGQRRENVRDAFVCLPSGLAGKRVLLVDDVCTTGSTLESACLALKQAGVSFVQAFTLARAK